MFNCFIKRLDEIGISPGDISLTACFRFPGIHFRKILLVTAHVMLA